MNQHDSQISRRSLLNCLAAGSAQLLAANRAVSRTQIRLTRQQKQEFLQNAKVVRTETPPEGRGDFLRATLNDGILVHQASIRTTDEERPFSKPTRISWKFDVAAYRLDRILGLNMVPVTVERAYLGQPASFIWWVDDVAMDEGARVRNRQQAPNLDDWIAQMHLMRVFDQLIRNVNRNLGSLLIDKNWQLWLIDHCWSFQPETTLQNSEILARCDSDLLARMKGLNAEALKRELSGYLDAMEIRALLARRDLIVRLFEGKGAPALYRLVRRPE